MNINSKFIFITGGVVSSLGKGITAASIGLLLKSRGYSVVIQKFDPYLNIDPGTMNPYQHGEVFVTEDGGETDLDLGHYERFTDVPLHKFNSTSAGKVYQAILDRERSGGYNGGTVQVVPHVTDEIQARIMKAAEDKPDFIISEIGGTVGDIEAQPFIEAIRQIHFKVGKKNCAFVHLGLLPYLKGCGEIKTKPMQHSVKEILSFGIQPDFLICRSERKITKSVREKLSLFSNIPLDSIIENYTAKSIYEVPIMLENEGLGNVICRHFGLENSVPNLTQWKAMLDSYHHPEKTVSIALVGKYVELSDAYLSVAEALTASCIFYKARLQLTRIDSINIDSPEKAQELLKDFDGIILPGGFGKRGIEGMVLTAEYARKSKTPYFGICLGMQIAIIEFARNVLNLKDAHSAEFSPECEHPVIDIMPDQQGVKVGGTLRLGLYSCLLKDCTKAHSAYNSDETHERHRHRYEFNNDYRSKFENTDMIFSGVNEERDLIEIAELKNHPWYVAVQFHPEFASRPNKPHPLFTGFIEQSILKSSNL